MLREVPLPKCLDKQLKMFGFEVPDIIGILLLLVVLNFFLGEMGNPVLFVWVPTAFCAALLWVGKRGKPENYLYHWFKFQLKHGTLCAFPQPTKWEPFQEKRRE